MIVRKIELKNFRQYIDTTIEFSTDKEKNITLVMGDNGTGKTTLMNILGNIIPRDSGSIELFGEVYDEKEVQRNVYPSACNLSPECSPEACLRHTACKLHYSCGECED